MLDIGFIRERAADVQRAADRKGIALSVGELLEVDERRRAQLRETEALRAERNRSSKAIEGLLREGRKAEAEQEKGAASAALAKLKALEEQFRQTERLYEVLMLQVPNIISPDTPDGAGDRDNVEIRRVGEPPAFGFGPRSHVELGESLGIVDLARGVKIGGARQYVLKNGGLLLHRAVQQLALDLLHRKGFDLLDVPALVKEGTMLATGFFPAGRDQSYAVQGEDKWLAGTSEVPLVSYYAGEVIDLDRPKLLGAASACYRSEVGSAGRDVHGLYRVHQFAKVEQVVLCRAEQDEGLAWLERLAANSEELLRLLELPYRVVAVCGGDLSAKNYKQYDIETWMPSRDGYGETHSASLLLDYQARRSNIRYRDEDGRLRHPYTLNNTMAATPRILIPLLENHQREDGSVRVPEALRPYMYGIEALRPETEA
ncbi:seryl-tRNA synthetase [Paenibacillus sp. UNC496MF]|uniref:serine--tRNA ligase n=1 Tax=Paenibacillus sp. UNC496MF TaxID=1502753 RepID=UPI0008EA0592|nr:serine--tRNA ligase [Paenibacillus sp. UNC496MF]SFI33058.1 seryl-tRNA synthetase [Paenibacillus sp. UNC496MF]